MIKTIIGIFLTTLLYINVYVPPLQAKDANHTQPWSKNAILAKARKQNFLVQAESFKVYQAREAVKASFGGLFPNLNIRNLIDFSTLGFAGVFNPVMLLRNIGNFLPFLMPGNWFKWRESKYFYLSERKQFQALRGNTLLATEELIIAIDQHKQILNALNKQIAILERLHKHITFRAKLMEVKPDVFLKLANRIILLRQDARSLDTVMVKEYAALSRAVGLDPADTNTAITGVKTLQMPDIEALEEQIVNSETVDHIRSISLALKSMKYLIIAARYSRKSRLFQWMNPMTTGPGNIGVGLPAYFRIGKYKVKEIRARRDDLRLRIAEKAINAAELANSNNLNLQETEVGFRNAELSFEQNLFEVATVKEIDPTKLLNASFELLIFDILLHKQLAQYRMATARLSRLLQIGHYANLDKDTPSNSGKLSKLQRRENRRLAKLEAAGKIDLNAVD